MLQPLGIDEEADDTPAIADAVDVSVDAPGDVDGREDAIGQQEPVLAKGTVGIRHCNELRAQYKAAWDAHQVIAHRNVMTRNSGGEPTEAQLASEREAAKAAEAARDELLAALSRL